jgi:hypothetical protein
MRGRVSRFVIEDEVHCDWHGQFAKLEEAIAKLRRLSGTPWDQPPNVAPCTNWQSCRREYSIIEFDDFHTPWKELRRIAALDVSSSGVTWRLPEEPPRVE